MTYQLATVERWMAESPLLGMLRARCSSALGVSALVMELLEELARAWDDSLALRAQLHAAMRAGSVDADAVQPSLSAPEQRVLGALQIIVAKDAVMDCAQRHALAPQVEGALALDGLSGLLQDEPEALVRRCCAMAARFLEQAPAAASVASADAALQAIAAFFCLLERAVRRLVEGGEHAELLRKLAGRSLQVELRNYRGLTRVLPHAQASELLPVTLEDVVGNAEYVAAAQRLARDVAGFDIESGKNPKRLNQVLFALGRPGCGKTITAHAVGRYFLEFCEQRGVKAQFFVVRRSDWASSYQNASASNLIRLFQERVNEFDGVTGMYWPDIDTALASRDSSELRTEEKQNLGAIFGVFDGTILPRDGSWFLMCDANTTHMDEAAMSRIAQNPMQVRGAESPEEYVRLMRDVCLREQRAQLALSESEWLKLGQLCAEHDLSGRNVDAICGNIRSEIQNFEYPDEYFSASHARKLELVAQLSRVVDAGLLERELREFVSFRLESERQAEERAFRRAVDDIVLQMNAGRAASASLAMPGE